LVPDYTTPVLHGEAAIERATRKAVPCRAVRAPGADNAALLGRFSEAAAGKL